MSYYIYLLESNNATILNSSGTQHSRPTTHSVSQYATIRTDGTNVWMTEEEKLYKYDQTLSSQQWSYTSTSASIFHHGLGIDSTGNAFLGDDEGNITKVNSSGTTEWIYNSTLNEETFVEALADGGCIYVIPSGTDTELKRLTSTGGVHTTYDTSSYTPIDLNDYRVPLAANEDGQVWCSIGGGGIGKWSSSGGFLFTFSNAPADPAGLSADSNGQVFAGIDESSGMITAMRYSSSGNLSYGNGGTNGKSWGTAATSTGAWYVARGDRVDMFSSGDTSIWNYSVSVNILSIDAKNGRISGGLQADAGTDVTVSPFTPESLNQSLAPNISIAEDLTLAVNTAESQSLSLTPSVTILKIVFPETAESETTTLQPNIDLATDGIVYAETAESVTETLVSNLDLETDRTVIVNTAESETETLPVGITGDVDLSVWTPFSISQAYDPVVSSTLPLEVDSIAYIDQTIPLYNASKERLEYQDLSEGGYTAGGNYQKDEIGVKRIWKIDLQYLRSSEYNEIKDYLVDNLFGKTDFWLESFGGAPSMTSVDAIVEIEQDERVQFGKDGVWEGAGHNLTLVVKEI